MPFFLAKLIFSHSYANYTSRKPVKRRRTDEKMRGFFCYSPAVIKGLKKVTNLFQIGLYPRKTVKFAKFSKKQVCNVKRRSCNVYCYQGLKFMRNKASDRIKVLIA